MPTFVSVGNARQPFMRLTEAVSRIAARLPAPVVVQHGHTPFDCPVCEGRAFIEMDEFAGLMARSRLIILHAGAGSILQALDAGKYPVVMPRRLAHGEHIDDHQLELAQAFAGRGLVELAIGAGGSRTRPSSAHWLGRANRQEDGTTGCRACLPRNSKAMRATAPRAAIKS